MAETVAVEAAPRWDHRQWTLLFVLSGNMILDALEVSVVLLALPVIGADLHLTLWTVQWLMSGFALGFAALLIAGPVLAARWGRRRTYLCAMALFVLASVVGGAAHSAALLIASRVVKGFAAALTAPAGLAVITAEFPPGAQQRKAVSIYSLFGAAGFTAGLLLSGALTAASWRWVFLFPAPVALALLVVGWRAIPAAAAPRPPRVRLSLLRNGYLSRSALGAATLNGGYIGLLLLITVQARQLFQWQPWQLALALLPACVPLVIAAPFGGLLVARFGTARLIAAGALLALAGEVLYLARPLPESYPAGLLPVLLLVEAGFVVSFAALNMQATATVEPALRGVAVPLYQTGVQLGAVVMLPVVAASLTVSDDYRPALLAIVVAGAIGAVTGVSGLLPSRKVQL